MKDEIEWLNFRWGLDVQYTLKENAPLLRGLCEKYKLFWDGNGFFYKIQSSVILRWPDWRNHYRVDMEKVRIRKNQSNKQKKLTKYVEASA